MKSGDYIGDLRNWHETTLWSSIQQKGGAEARAVITALQAAFPDIQRILAHAHTDPLDFTLHDEGHAFRVAQRMAEMLVRPAGLLDKLSVHELAFLLLSAYLHDIGMTPEMKKVRLHRNYLLQGLSPISSPTDRALSPDEATAFQAWLDDHGRGIEPPIPVEQMNLADELLTYYCRFKHTDWGEEWTRANLSGKRLGRYTNWVEDLILLCRSHHADYGQLAGDGFRPILLPGDDVLHIRFLACLLRVADIMEFDPERTPQVVFRHRDVHHASSMYWWKDHYITCTQEDERFVITARLPNARLHRAVELMVDDIDRELALCRRLADDVHFDHCPGLKRKLPHRWDFLPSAHRMIEAEHGAYEYINGAFRPDTGRLLELLSGTQLYGSEMAAIREMLQNAFDAVREEIAYRRLDSATPNDPKLVDALRIAHCVTLALRTDGESVTLSCEDNGVGMNKKIITDHLLVTGNAVRHDLLDLERRCRSAQFVLGRTGQFGIGVLSYFMLGDHLEVRTRRSTQPKDDEGHGWYFETDGIGHFGELRKDTVLTQGTRVSLRLRRTMDSADLLAFAHGVRDYLQKTLVRVPCRFEFDTGLSDCPGLAYAPGWCHTSGQLADRLVAQMLHRARERTADHDPPVPGLTLTNWEDSRRAWETAAAEALACLEWTHYQNTLYDASGVPLGDYRLSIPSFHLPGGTCLAFMRSRLDGGQLVVDKIDYEHTYTPSFLLTAAWKGAAIDLRTDPESDYLRLTRDLPEFCALRIDLYSSAAGSPSVNRQTLLLSQQATSQMESIAGAARALLLEIAAADPHSPYAWFNYVAAGSTPPDGTEPLWLLSNYPGRGKQALWSPITMPAISDHESLYPYDAVTWQDKTVWQPLSVSSGGECCFPPCYPPQRIAVMAAGEDFAVVPLWTELRMSEPTDAEHTLCQFPPEWADVLTLQCRLSIWNPNHPVTVAAARSAWLWRPSSSTRLDDPIAHKAYLLSSLPIAAAWLADLVAAWDSEHIWGQITAYAPDLLPDIWQFVLGSVDTPLYVLNACGDDRGSGTFLAVLTGRKTIKYHQPDDILAQLPELGPDWRLRPLPSDDPPAP